MCVCVDVCGSDSIILPFGENKSYGLGFGLWSLSALESFLWTHFVVLGDSVDLSGWSPWVRGEGGKFYLMFSSWSCP